MEKCIVLGGEGMLGHMVVKYIKSLPDFEVFSTVRNETTKSGIYFDAYKDLGKIEEIIKKIKPKLVINCIGFVNHIIKEQDKDVVVFINSYFPHKLANICRLNNSKLIHISTDAVFSGEEGNYTEDSPYSSIDFYGISKATGEIKDDHNLTIRTSIIGPEIKEPKTGLMEWFFKQNEKTVKGFTKYIFSGLTTLELAKKIIEMYKNNVTGLINIASKPISKYDILCLIKNIYHLNINVIPNENPICDRSMKSIRKDIKYNIPTHEEMVKELKNWQESLN